MKRTINESQLKAIVAESVKRVLNEMDRKTYQWAAEEEDRGETPYLDAPEMSEDEIDNVFSSQINDERIKGVYDGENYFPRGTRGYVVAFRKWLLYKNDKLNNYRYRNGKRFPLR
jgi:hypothetical protein